MSFTLIPFFLFYVAPIVFVVWAILTIIKHQKESNILLQEIINKFKDN